MNPLPRKPLRIKQFAHLHYNNVVLWGQKSKEYFVNQQLPQDVWVIHVGVECTKCGKVMIPHEIGWIRRTECAGSVELRCEDCIEEGFVPFPLMKEKMLGFIMINKEIYDYHRKYYDENITDEQAKEFADNYDYSKWIIKKK